jgi:hypothetical protein
MPPDPFLVEMQAVAVSWLRAAASQGGETGAKRQSRKVGLSRQGVNGQAR